MKKTIVVLALLAALSLIVSAAFAQGGPAGPGQQGHGKGWMSKLTQEQRTQLQAKVKELRAANAKPEEIKAAVAELCKGWGLEPPKAGGFGPGGGPGQGNGNAPSVALTAEQWTQLEAKLKELRAANAKSDEIRTAIAELYKGWGLAAPKAGGLGPGGGPGQGQGNGNRFGANLTADQRTQLQAKIKELKDNGAKHEEIKAAIAELYKGWGIEPPKAERFGPGGGPGQGNGNRFGANLTEEQRTQLQAKLKELKDKGAKHGEIQSAVTELFKGWGLEPPQFGGAGKGQGRGGAGKGPMQEMLKGLTDEQRTQVLTKMDELKKAGSPPEEIKRTIMEMVKGFGDKV